MDHVGPGRQSERCDSSGGGQTFSMEKRRQLPYCTFATNAAFFGHEKLSFPAATFISSAEAQSAVLKMKPVPCSTRTCSGSFVTGLRIGPSEAERAAPTLKPL